MYDVQESKATSSSTATSSSAASSAAQADRLQQRRDKQLQSCASKAPTAKVVMCLMRSNLIYLCSLCLKQGSWCIARCGVWLYVSEWSLRQIRWLLLICVQTCSLGILYSHVLIVIATCCRVLVGCTLFIQMTHMHTSITFIIFYSCVGVHIQHLHTQCSMPDDGVDFGVFRNFCHGRCHLVAFVEGFDPHVA